MTGSGTPSDARTLRLGRLARLPVFFTLAGKRAVVAGGGAPAAWKAELLSAAGAAVDVFAPEPTEEMAAAAAEATAGRITLHPRTWAEADLEGAAIAVGAFEDDADANRFAAAARARGVPVNVVDKPAYCDFSFGSIVNRSPLVVGISTGGAAPVFAQAVRTKLEALIPMGFARWAEAAQRWRAAVQSSGLSFSKRRRLWQRFAARALAEPDRIPGDAELRSLLSQAEDEHAGAELGTVTLVGAGPGDAELLTLRAVRALQAADVILIDDLVPADVLDFARREARKLRVGETGYARRPEELGALMVSLAGDGNRVLRLVAGDPVSSGRAVEELAACERGGIAVEVVPGITTRQIRRPTS